MQGRTSQAREEIEIRLFGCSVGNLASLTRGNPKAARLWVLISRNYADQLLSLRGTARSLGVSQDHLNRALCKASGFTFKQLLIRVRLLAALELVWREPETRREEIALRVGFSTLSAFQKQCRQKMPGRFPTRRIKQRK
ncbi:MAG: helix-turn-helix domain-containing protein [Blastocatellia bacterium]